MRRSKNDSIVPTNSRNLLEKVKANKSIPSEFNEEYCDKFQETLITFLDYAEKGDELPDEEVAKEKELFRWFKHGLKAGHLRGGDTLNKLTSPDVFYILTTKFTSKHLADKFGVDSHIIKMIRRGEAPGWEWEHKVVQKIMSIVRNRGLNRPRSRDRHIYILYELNRKTLEKKILHTSLGKTTIHRTRERIITPRELEKHKNAGTLNYYYPIEAELISS